MADSLSQQEQRAYNLVTARGGILQSQLWKELDADSRHGSRLATSLAEKGLITREPTTDDGQRTYLLMPTAEVSPQESRNERPPQEDPAPEDTDENLSDRERRTLSLIEDGGGIFQSELWKELDVTSRTGSRIATGLEEKGAIRRTETTYNGQRTYFLQLTKRNLDFSLLMAGEIISPFIGGDEDLDPIESDEFTEWILHLGID